MALRKNLMSRAMAGVVILPGACAGPEKEQKCTGA
jgi:hypothetical protein